MSILDEVTIVTADLDEVLKVLDEKGVAVIPEYVAPEDLAALNEEFESILGAGLAGVKAQEYSTGRAAIITRAKADVGEIPATLRVFTDPFMAQLKDAYWGKQASLNSEIFVVNDVVGGKHHANDLHYDVSPTFKFFIYLTDTTTENGAFACVPGSHKVTRELRQERARKISTKNRYLTRELPVKEGDVVAMEGRAGTVIIFNTEVWHQAGTVVQGERKVIRGHCRKVGDTSIVRKLLRRLLPS